MSDPVTKGRVEEFVFLDEEDRPLVAQYTNIPKFRVGDKVFLLRSDGSRAGPFVVATVPSAQDYTLSQEGGQSVENGKKFVTAQLEAA